LSAYSSAFDVSSAFTAVGASSQQQQRQRKVLLQRRARHRMSRRRMLAGLGQLRRAGWASAAASPTSRTYLSRSSAKDRVASSFLPWRRQMCETMSASVSSELECSCSSNSSRHLWMQRFSCVYSHAFLISSVLMDRQTAVGMGVRVFGLWFDLCSGVLLFQ